MARGRPKRRCKRSRRKSSYKPPKGSRPGDGRRSAAMRRRGMSGALIGHLGRKKYGRKRMAKMSAAGRKRKRRRR